MPPKGHFLFKDRAKYRLRLAQQNREKCARNGFRRRELLDMLKDEPCMDCGKRFSPECMDFDHVRGRKRIAIGPHKRCSWKRLEKELAKCDLVCANCHRTRTKQRRTRNA